MINMGSLNSFFLYQGNKLIYPNPVKDGLVLWYDFKGIKNSDVNKDVTKNLSNNDNLVAQQFNFAYTNESGYGNKGLKFDGIDDRVIPIIKHPDNTVGQLDMKKINNGQKFSVEISLKMTEKIMTQGSEIFMTNKTYGRFWIQFIKDFNITSSDEFVVSASTYYGTEGGRSVYAYSTKEGYKYGDEFHITVTLDKNDKLILYINGVKKDERLLNDIDIVTTQEKDLITFLGQGNVDVYYRRFEHELYSLKVYNRVLSEAEIKHNYQIEKKRWDLL